MLLPHPRKVFVLVTSDDRVPPLWLARMIQRTTCGLAITLRVPEQRCVPSCRFSAFEPLKKLPEDRLPLTTTCSRRVPAVRRHVREITTNKQGKFRAIHRNVCSPPFAVHSSGCTHCPHAPGHSKLLQPSCTIEIPPLARNPGGLPPSSLVNRETVHRARHRPAHPAHALRTHTRLHSPRSLVCVAVHHNASHVRCAG